MSHNNLDYNNYQPYLDELVNLSNLFSKNRLMLCLYGGTLLGAARNHDFIPTDDDIDVLYISKKTTKKTAIIDFETNVIPLLNKYNYEVKPISWTVRGQPRLCLGQYHLIHNNISIDLFIGWINSEHKFFASHCILGSLQDTDIFPLILLQLKNETFFAPNKYELLLTALYTAAWETPSNYRPSLNPYFIQKKVLKLIDQYGWAYHFIAKSQKKYSVHQIDYVRLCDFKQEILEQYDILYIPSPRLSTTRVKNIIALCRQSYPKIKIIAAYAGETENTYTSADLIVSISSHFLPILKSLYSNIPTIFLPECTDCNFFPIKKVKSNSFIVGYAGRTHPVKRLYLLDKLNYKVKKQTDHDAQFLTETRTLDPMRKFYHSLDCFVLVSSTECMPGVILEAMACGLPVVATDVGSINLLLDPEWLVPSAPEDILIEEMNKKLSILHHSPKIRKRVGKRNRNHIKQFFNWENIQELWDDVFDALYQSNFVKIKELVQIYYANFQILQQLDAVDLPPRTTVVHTPTRIDENIEFLPPITKKAMTSEDIIKYLLENNIDFWLIKDSCYQAVVKNNLNTAILQIGVKNKDIKDKLEKMEFSNILEISIGSNIKVKSFQVNMSIIQVPLPVVPYLESYTHKSWEALQNEK